MKKISKKFGRKTVMTPDIIVKIEAAFAIGATDQESCYFAGIGESTLYDYQATHPKFSERKGLLKLNPVLKARQTIYDNLHDTQTAKWFLERKRSSEFGKLAELSNNNQPTTLFDFLSMELDERP